MLRSLKDLEGYAVNATDGDIGHVADFLLDDERWIVRYLVVETGGFFSGRRVLITPISFRQVDWSTRSFHLALTRTRSRTVRVWTWTSPSRGSRSWTCSGTTNIRITGDTRDCGAWAPTRTCWRLAGGTRCLPSPSPLNQATSICVAPKRFADTTLRERTQRSATSTTSSSTMRPGRYAIW